MNSSGAMIDCKKEGGDIATSKELSHTVFSFFVCIEPGETRSANLTYTLPSRFSASENKDHAISVFIDKQAGTLGDSLILEAQFNKRIKTINPSVDKLQQISDTHVLLQSTLNRDRSYTFSF